METVESWLNYASKKLKSAEIASAKLDSELILARVLKVERTTLHAFPGRKLHKQQVFHANNWLNLRENRIPLAYIFGEKDFFGRTFKVSKSVLVPRPETENLILMYKKFIQPFFEQNNQRDFLLDIGTGSGIIATTITLEMNKNSQPPKVFLSDISDEALDLAKVNFRNLTHQKGVFHISDLLEQIPYSTKNKITTIVANLPYVNCDWIDFEQKNELHHEPQNALYANDGGLELIKKLIQQSQPLPKLKFILLEADPVQFDEIKDFAAKFNFKLVASDGYSILFAKL